MRKTNVIILSFLISIHRYNLTDVILMLFLINFISFLLGEYKRVKETIQNPVLIQALVTICICLLIAGLVATHTPLFQSITLDEVSVIVTFEARKNCYEFVGHLDFHDECNFINISWIENDAENHH